MQRRGIGGRRRRASYDRRRRRQATSQAIVGEASQSRGEKGGEGDIAIALMLLVVEQHRR